jgi:hypothetical protein
MAAGGPDKDNQNLLQCRRLLAMGICIVAIGETTADGRWDTGWWSVGTPTTGERWESIVYSNPQRIDLVRPLRHYQIGVQNIFQFFQPERF